MTSTRVVETPVPVIFAQASQDGLSTNYKIALGVGTGFGVPSIGLGIAALVASRARKAAQARQYRATEARNGSWRNTGSVYPVVDDRR